MTAAAIGAAAATACHRGGGCRPARVVAAALNHELLRAQQNSE
jgi:hypothetical protein